MTITLDAPRTLFTGRPLVLAATTVVAWCITCGDLCLVNPATGHADHRADVCRECFQHDHLPCVNLDQHGTHYQHSVVECVVAEPLQCAWCHAYCDAEQDPCPDHRVCCGNCCQPN